MELTSKDYKKAARKAIGDSVLQSALTGLQGRLGPATATLYNDLPEGPDLRKLAYQYRRKAVDNLDIMLITLAENIRKQGGEVHFAPTARDAVNICLDIAEKNNVKKVVKGKSMVTEELGLNQALMEKGIEVNETDLGEYIIQLAGGKTLTYCCSGHPQNPQRNRQTFFRKTGHSLHR